MLNGRAGNMLWRCALVILLCLVVFLGFYTIRVKNRTGPSSASIEVSIVDEEAVVAKKRYKQHVPKFMLDLYQQNANESRRIDGPDVVRSVIPKTTGFISGNNEESCENKHMLIFELPGSSKDEVFLSAELKILSISSNKDYDELERFVKISIFDESNGELLFLDKLRLYSKNNTWLSFNLTTPIHVILQNGTGKHIKVLISIKSEIRDNFKLSLMPDVENFEHDYPILLLSYNTANEKPNHRNKREVMIKNPNHMKSNKIGLPQNPNGMDETNTSQIKSKNFPKLSNYRNARIQIEDADDGQIEEDVLMLVNRKKRNTFEEDYEEDTNNVWDDDNQRKVVNKKLKRLRNTCRRKPMFVDFSEIDYDSWIVQPSGYEAFQCSGKCFYPVAEHLSPTKHAIVQALVHSLSPTKASRSCCVPTELEPISVLYIDSKGVLTYRYAYRDMVVTECGCR